LLEVGVDVLGRGVAGQIDHELVHGGADGAAIEYVESGVVASDLSVLGAGDQLQGQVHGEVDVVGEGPDGPRSGPGQRDQLRLRRPVGVAEPGQDAVAGVKFLLERVDD